MKKTLRYAVALFTLAASLSAEPRKASDIVVSGYTGVSTLENFPVLVRISEERISGFSYSECAAGGADISFATADGETILAHEIDTWDPTGESLVWVRVPSISGTDTAFTLRWADAIPPSVTASDVWSAGYAGVWHLGESGSGGISTNSTANGSILNGENTPGTLGVAGKLGGGRQISDSSDSRSKVGGIFVDGSQDCTKFDGVFTISGWFWHRNQSYYYDHIFYKRGWNNTSAGGIGIEMSGESIRIRGASNAGPTISPTTLKETWSHLAFVFDDTTTILYQDGVEIGRGAIANAFDNDLRWAFGNDKDGYGGAVGDSSWKGVMDEVRLRAGATSPDWAKAEYDTMADASFLTYGNAETLRDDAMLSILGVPAAIGSPTPAYGQITGLAANDPVALSMSATAVAGEGTVTNYLAGWTLESVNLNTGARTPVRSSADPGESTSSCAYVHSGYAIFTWLWDVRDALGVGLPSLIGEGASDFTLSIPVSGIGYTAPSATLKIAYGLSPDNLSATNVVSASVTAIDTFEATLPRLAATGAHYVRAVLETNCGNPEIAESPVLCVAESVASGSVFYVSETGGDANNGSEEHPFATISNAIVKAESAIARGAPLVIINVADGSYPENGLTVTNAIVITGNASDRTAVKIGTSGARVFRIAHADAALRNLTVQNGTVASSAVADAGGNVRLEAGTVTNCVLSGGGNTSITDGRGGNLYISGGMVVDSLLTSPLVGSGSLGPGAYIAGGVVSRCIIEKAPAKTGTWLAIGSGAYLIGGVIENCLVRDNHAGKGAIYLNAASAKAVNCTIVDNTPDTGSGGGIGGVYVNNSSASVVNCVIFGNGGTAASEWANLYGARFFNCVSTVDNASGANWIKLPLTNKSSYFEDGEYWTPLLGSPMVDGGDDALYPSTSSQTDIAGNTRISGHHIDIGCSEFDQSRFNVTATVASYPSVLKGGMVDFACSAVGASDTVTYELDFGDGSAHLVTTDSRVSRRFDVAGLFRTRIRAKEGSGEYGDWVTVSVPVRVAEADIYVSPEGSDANAGTAAAPFLTVAHALATLTNVNSSCATDVDGVTVHVAAGTYEENGLPAIGSRVTVEGDASDRTAVKVGKSGTRIFCIAHADAVLRNLTVQNGTVTAADVAYAGGNVRLENGTVTNCVLTGGSATVQDGKGLNLYIRSGMAVDSVLTSPLVGSGPLGVGAYIAGGVVSRCIIEKAPAKTGTWLPIGSGAYLTGGVIANCLVRDNKAGKGAIYLDAASAKAVNCTIVGNTPASGTGGGIGGVYVNNASALVVNCVIYGNGGTALAEWGNKNAARFYSCAFSAGAAFTGANSTVKDLTDAAFKNIANGDYRPKSGGALFNAGDNGLYAFYATSETDLDGNPRVLNKSIDLGCWEVMSGASTRIILR